MENTFYPNDTGRNLWTVCGETVPFQDKPLARGSKIASRQCVKIHTARPRFT